MFPIYLAIAIALAVAVGAGLWAYRENNRD